MPNASCIYAMCSSTSVAAVGSWQRWEAVVEGSGLSWVVDGPDPCLTHAMVVIATSLGNQAANIFSGRAGTVPVAMPDPKYSVSELEQRFLLSELPQELSQPRRIRDLYIEGARLRLRIVEDLDGFVLQRKLGHKRRIEEGDPSIVKHTSLYLSEPEYRILSAVGGRPLVKVRWKVETNGVRAAVDVFEGELEGLVMLEVEFRVDDELTAFRPSEWAGVEVTNREEFSGGALSATTREGVNELLRELGQPSASR